MVVETEERTFDGNITVGLSGVGMNMGGQKRTTMVQKFVYAETSHSDAISRPLEGHSCSVNSIAFSPDGRCIITHMTRPFICGIQRPVMQCQSCLRDILIRSIPLHFCLMGSTLCLAPGPSKVNAAALMHLATEDVSNMLNLYHVL
jgi:hypothetical protein